jgi:hypothetical protein
MACWLPIQLAMIRQMGSSEDTLTSFADRHWTHPSHELGICLANIRDVAIATRGSATPGRGRNPVSRRWPGSRTHHGLGRRRIWAEFERHRPIFGASDHRVDPPRHLGEEAFGCCALPRCSCSTRRNSTCLGAQRPVGGDVRQRDVTPCVSREIIDRSATIPFRGRPSKDLVEADHPRGQAAIGGRIPRRRPSGYRLRHAVPRGKLAT